MDARVAAAKALEEVIRHGRSLSAVMPHWQEKVAAKDRALLQEICYGVLRWYWRLDVIAARLLRKPFKAKDTDVSCLILIGLYQMEYLRVPDHAAVSETVAATKALKKPWARGLVNAVLRNFQRDKQIILVELDKGLQSRYSHPKWLIERLQQAYSDDWASILEANNQRPPMYLRINARQCNRATYFESLRQAGHQAIKLDWCDEGLVLESAADVERLPGFSEGQFSVQDAAAQLAAGLLDAQPGERVLDACAAPGGKAAHVLELQPQLAEMVALDHDAQRLERLEQNFKRLGFSATVICADASRTDEWWDGQPFDRILLDAPCSATGVIRRHPDIKLLRRESDIGQLIKLQANILSGLWLLLKPGGMLLYATCSVLPQENVKQLQHFCAGHADAEHLPITAAWGSEQTIGRQILPGREGMDGFYYACLRKRTNAG